MENEKFLIHLCNHIKADLQFQDTEDGIIAIMINRSDNDKLFKIQSLQKKEKEEACLSIIKQLLSPDLSNHLEFPISSSVEEFKMKINILYP